MASNSFGKFFKITTWGESHGKAIGIVIDGCPSGIEIFEEDLNKELKKRRSTNNLFISERKEQDKVQILSGVYKNKTTGTPISLIIKNTDTDAGWYDEIKDLYRPGHANFTYIQKYKIFDHYGGGRASGRETAARIAAGAIAKKLLKYYEIEVAAFLKSVGLIEADIDVSDFTVLKSRINASLIFCPDAKKEKKMLHLLKKIKKEKDSIGGVVQLTTTELPIGLGEPIYEKLSATLAKALISIPGCISFEIGKGFEASKMKGSENNDLFDLKKDKIVTKTNNCGGILAGISTGMPLDIKVAFKPTPTIGKAQQTLNINKEKKKIIPPDTFRHDSCIAIRACKVVEAMCAIVLINAVLALKKNN